MTNPEHGNGHFLSPSQLKEQERGDAILEASGLDIRKLPNAAVRALVWGWQTLIGTRPGINATGKFKSAVDAIKDGQRIAAENTGEYSVAKDLPGRRR